MPGDRMDEVVAGLMRCTRAGMVTRRANPDRRPTVEEMVAAISADAVAYATEEERKAKEARRKVRRED